ncbi:hypothetical protein PY092_10005 [Muricauda sp. 334s03]|uniref:Uncharacterized protein n=1 Tax=Flagellimonas yonaguniensis TaxID=3031325 RepID=A0ABT5XZ66_9FLAO|nr:hypothetical protein [[Muricauda] yonaguniensis]MDF0716482.1 hypothetical protein [[Muricauda] yonaguniensis]
MSLFEKYDLELKIILDRIHVVTDVKSTQILAQFLDLWNRSKDIKEDLLPELNPVLNGEMEFNDIGADVVGVAYIEANTTKLMGSDVGYSDLELPTEDFKELIMQWLSILEKEGR